jgi:LSD1 subclass zinc finger protein
MSNGIGYTNGYKNTRCPDCQAVTYCDLNDHSRLHNTDGSPHTCGAKADIDSEK